ncbi:MAG: ABC transporter permease [Acidobacteriia bacterium]|nr:ABC transporter permease [Terriglobia bacterium]
MPDWQRYVRDRLPPLRIGPERENEIVAELALQLEQAFSDAIAAGASQAEAALRAEAQFQDWNALAGEIESVERHTSPPPRGLPRNAVEGCLQDLGYAVRLLRRSPAASALAVATLAAGLGGSAAIFAIADAVALRGLPYADSKRLMAVETHKSRQPELEAWTSMPDLLDLRRRTGAFSLIAGVSPVWNLVMTGRGDAERLECLYVSAEFFPMLGVRAALGRTFLSSEDGEKPSAVVVLSDAFWRRRFGGARDVVGRAATLDGGVYTIVGVLPAGFRYVGEPLAGTAGEIDAWLPLSANQLRDSARSLRFLKAIGRLKPGVSVEQGRADVRRIGTALSAEYPEACRGYAYDAQPLAAVSAGRVRTAMMMLLGAVGFVMVMACANVANLLLTRLSARRRELSVRAALGASRFRLARQLLAEGFVMAAAAAVFSSFAAIGLLRWLMSIAPPSLVKPGEVAVGGRTLLFAAVAALACAFVAGMPPAWRAARSDLETGLRESGRSLAPGRHRLRSALVVLQIALALALTTGAGLLIHSFRRVLDVDPGFDARNLLTISTQLPMSARTPPERTAVWRRLREALSRAPGVRAVAAVSRLPLLGKNLSSWLYVEGRPMPAAEPGFDVEYRVATAEYFATMGIPLRRGRRFDEHDDANPGAVLLVNESAARTFWPGQDPVGRRVKLGAPSANSPWITVVGVVGDIHHAGLETEMRPEIYRPYAVNPLSAPILVIRTSGDAAALMPMLAATVRSTAAGMPAYNIFQMEELLARSMAQRRFLMLLLTGFAAAALLLAGVGIYGTVSQSVALRTREIGVRMALGAEPAAALRLVFESGFRLIGIGLGLGWVAVAALTRLVRSLLFEVRPLDAAALAGAAVVLACFALAACYFPARRATRIDPIAALREDG